MNDGKFACPFCHHCANVLTDPKTKKPKTDPEPGDLTVCLVCAEVLEFQPDLTLAMASVHQLMGMSPEQHAQIASVQRQVREGRFNV